MSSFAADVPTQVAENEKELIEALIHLSSDIQDGINHGYSVVSMLLWRCESRQGCLFLEPSIPRAHRLALDAMPGVGSTLLLAGPYGRVLA
ncbi:hypothetical protein GOP47_0003905 [Adiantum capillus-veneris]|uniref:Uncharacterized protein n=1 Tax=Adiantum capillus-veneris TaxID=13818 RepID=A0A9D4ZP06_ADICA|nr:hypothetical protein GOP47_0003905 [Adiantum capillus-veneris]